MLKHVETWRQGFNLVQECISRIKWVLFRHVSTPDVFKFPFCGWYILNSGRMIPDHRKAWLSPDIDMGFTLIPFRSIHHESWPHGILLFPSVDSSESEKWPRRVGHERRLYCILCVVPGAGGGPVVDVSCHPHAKILGDLRGSSTVTVRTSGRANPAERAHGRALRGRCLCILPPQP